MTKTPFMIAAFVAMTASAGSLSAQSSLKDEPAIREGLIAVGIAYEISEVCGSISARTLRGLGYLNQLRNAAIDLGYSRAQVRAYTDDKAEQNRLEGIARTRLANMGAAPGDAASHCTVGQAEIAKGSTIGYLIR